MSLPIKGGLEVDTGPERVHAHAHLRDEEAEEHVLGYFYNWRIEMSSSGRSNNIKCKMR